MRKFRIALLLFSAFDFFFGGTMGGFLALTPVAAAQNKPQYPFVSGAPDCLLVPSAPFTAVGDSLVYDNRNQGCTTWHLVYNSQGFSALNISFKSADDSGNGPSTFNNWGTSGGTLATGTTLPLTAITSGQATGYKYRPFVKISVTSLTGTGTLWPMLYGYRPGIADSSGTSGFSSPTFTSGTPSAITLPGYPMMCDTQTGAGVTAGQLTMLRCTPDGKLALVQSAGGDGGTASPSGFIAANSAALNPVVVPVLYNTTGAATYNLPRSVSANTMTASSTQTARNAIGAQMTERGSRWVVTSAPAAGSVGSASIPLEAGVKHVATQVCFSAGSIAAPAATSLQVNIRDGATGAGTVLMTFEVDIPAAAGNNQPPFCTGDLNLVGTAGTAMTAEWSSLLANLKESVSLIGYNVN